ICLCFIRPSLIMGFWLTPGAPGTTHSLRRATKQPREKVYPASRVAASPPANPRIIGYCQELPTCRVVMMLNGNIRNLAVSASEDGKQRLVAPVDILAKFQVASVAYESGLVGQVDRDEARKQNIDFVVTKHSPDAVLAVAFAWTHDRQQHFRILHRILHPHAAVAFSAPLIGEQIFLI